MKKILSITLAAVMLLSMIPTAFAADWQDGTTITLVGSQEAASYEVTVPATMSPGDTAKVSVSGNWASNQTLNVTCPDSVTLSYGDQTMDVGINFDEIHKLGSDTTASTAEANISVADASVLFGTWTGVLEYTVSCTTDTATILHMTIDGIDYMFKEGMTWKQWVESEYNTVGLYIEDTTVGGVPIQNIKLTGKSGFFSIVNSGAMPSVDDTIIADTAYGFVEP